MTKRADPPDYRFEDLPENDLDHKNPCGQCDMRTRLKEYGLGKWLPGGVQDVSCIPIPCNRTGNRHKRLRFTETPEQYRERVTP
jgi:hypothetical protein